ncbi:MAG: hypothetical protein ABFE01_09365 [Phycisphaerales bacterium]|jgi:hypothetical protein
MKSVKQIEQSVRRLSIEADAQTRERTFHDLVETHAQHKKKTQAFGLLRYGRIIMTQKPKRIAAVITVVLLILGVLGLGTGSVAFSQARHAVNSTLSWLKGMITGDTSAAPPESLGMGDQTPSSDRRELTCGTRLFTVHETERGLWQSLKDQGIEFVEASPDPQVRYAVLSREQAELFDASATLKCLAAPRVTVLEGEIATIALTDRPLRSGFALGWLPTVSSDGQGIQSTLSFHDGTNGFEIPDISTEPGGAVLIRVEAPPNRDDDAKEILIRVQVDVQPAP